MFFSLLSLVGYSTGAFFFEFDTTLQDVFMTVFFTAVGFSSNLKAFGRAGKIGLQLVAVIILIIIIENILGVTLASIFNLDPLIGLSTGSAALIGGHGTSAAFGPIFEDLGATSASTVALASATFGLVIGGVVGEPIGHYLMKKHKLSHHFNGNNDLDEHYNVENEDNIPSKEFSEKKLFTASYQIILAMGIGTIISYLLESIGLTFPAYIGGLLMGLIIRNVGEYSGKFDVPMREINTMGEIGLSLFVSMALMTLELWELADLAIPMIVILLIQIIVLILFLIFIAFRLLGKNYDAAVMITGVTGFGLGAMPTAVVNMEAFSSKYIPSPTAFFAITAIGSLAIDISNSLLLTFFMNIVS